MRLKFTLKDFLYFPDYKIYDELRNPIMDDSFYYSNIRWQGTFSFIMSTFTFGTVLLYTFFIIRFPVCISVFLCFFFVLFAWSTELVDLEIDRSSHLSIYLSTHVCYISETLKGTGEDTRFNTMRFCFRSQHLQETHHPDSSGLSPQWP